MKTKFGLILLTLTLGLMGLSGCSSEEKKNPEPKKATVQQHESKAIKQEDTQKEKSPTSQEKSSQIKGKREKSVKTPSKSSVSATPSTPQEFIVAIQSPLSEFFQAIQSDEKDFNQVVKGTMKKEDFLKHKSENLQNIKQKLDRVKEVPAKGEASAFKEKFVNILQRIYGVSDTRYNEAEKTDDLKTLAKNMVSVEKQIVDDFSALLAPYNTHK